MQKKACVLLTINGSDKTIAPKSTFLTKLLSGVDILLELQPEYLASQMLTSTDIQSALLKHNGKLGNLVEMKTFPSLRSLSLIIIQKLKTGPISF